MKTIINSIFKTFFLSLCVIANTHFAYAQTSSSILPPAKTQLLDNNGKPLVQGTVDYYVPGTSTRKTTWQDSGQTVPNTNPVVLDGGGRALMLGNGSYRQVVKDRLGNLIWDQITSSTGSGSGGGSATVGDGQPVGSVQLWAGFVAPSQYAFAYGQEFVRASFPELFQAITSQQNVTCSIGSPTLTSISSTEQLSVGAPIESTCLNAGATVVGKTASTVTASSNAIISTTAPARFFPYGNGDGSLTFNAPDYRGRVLPARDNMGGISANRLSVDPNGFGKTADGIGITGGNQQQTVTRPRLPNYSLIYTGTANQLVNVASTAGNVVQGSITSGSFNFSGGGGSVGTLLSSGAATSVINSQGSFTSSGTIESLNGGVTQVATPTVQPSILTNYVIKTLPDTNPNSYFGVASIGGMTGVIACGNGLTCAGGTISAVAPASVIPPPSASTLGGVLSSSCSTSNWFSSLNTSGVFGCTQPSYADLLATGNVPVSVLSPLFAANNTWSGTNNFASLRTIGGSGSNIQVMADCVRPEQYGAARNGTTDDTGPIIRAANAAFTSNVGLCLTGGSSYATTAIQFGVGVSNNNGTFTGSGASVGSIATTVMTITDASSIDIAPGMSVTGTGVTAGTTVQSFAGGTGQLGAYNITPSQTVASTALTFTAPNFTASISGTVMTVTAVANGFLRRGQNITGAGILEGTTISTLGTGTGGAGTYNLNYSQTIASTAMKANNVSVANIPIWIRGDSGQRSVFKGISPSGTIEKKYITIYNPTNQFSSDPPFGATYENFKVQGSTLYSLPFVVQGSLYSRIGNITVTGGLSCNVSFVANVLTGIIYNTFYNIYARGEGVSNGNGICITGKDQTLSYNFQLNDMSMIQAQGVPGDGWIIDWAKFSCTGCGSESNTGRSYRIDNTQRIVWIDSYSELNAAGGMIGTANTKGLIISGQYEDTFDPALLADPSNSFNYTQLGLNNRNGGNIKPSILTVATLPTCNAQYQGSILTVSDGLTPTFGTAVVGGGAVTTSVFCRSSGSWLVLSGPNLNAGQISAGTVPSANGGAGGVTGALRSNGSGVVTQAACADLSNGAASCSTDTTNASNISSGTLAVARGGVSQVAWSTYSPAYSTGSGSGATFTTNTARYQQSGKTVRVIVDYNCTAVGTGAGAVLITLPVTAAGFKAAGTGLSYSTNVGRIMTVYLSTGSPTIMQVMDGGPATGVTVNSFVVELEYEVP